MAFIHINENGKTMLLRKSIILSIVDHGTREKPAVYIDTPNNFHIIEGITARKFKAKYLNNGAPHEKQNN